MSRAAKQHRIAVFTLAQNELHGSAAPAHRASKTLARLVVAAGLGKWLQELKSLKLLVTTSWAEIKLRFKAVETPLTSTDTDSGAVRSSKPQRLLPPLDWYPAWAAAYPPIPQGFTERRKQADLWLAATAF